ncbi:hypothetical protein [Blastococcus mobilis]|uniref:hypothetical protein n=1 Tax=Blastococcus mobilis TaxID=1938746 RepID=UPI000B7961D6|nr:hypothetical protein [Blastococcus mobilis]
MWLLLAMAALLAATPVLAACGAGGPGSAPYVAEFGLGADTPEAREYELTPVPGPRVQVLPEPSHAPRMTLPDPGEGFELSYTPSPAPAPDSGGQSPLESAFRSSIAWVNEGQYLAVITHGSGSCPSGPDSIEVAAEQEIEIRLGPLFPGRDPCTADMSPHVTVVELPQGITPTKQLVARFGDHEATIEAASR